MRFVAKTKGAMICVRPRTRYYDAAGETVRVVSEVIVRFDDAGRFDSEAAQREHGWTDRERGMAETACRGVLGRSLGAEQAA